MRVATVSQRYSAPAVLGATMALLLPMPDTSHAQDTSGLSLELLAATRDKPLFSPTRQRPPAQNIAVAANEPDDKQAAEENARPTYALVGIIAGAEAVVVLLRDSKKDQLIKVRSGDRVGSWLVSATSNYSVELTNGSKKLNLAIFAE